MSIVERAAKGHGKSMTWLCEDNKAELYALCRALLDEEQAVKMTVAVMNDYAQAAAQNITDEATYTRWLLTEAAMRCGAKVLEGEAPQTVSTVPRAKFVRAVAVYNGDMAEGEQALSEMLAPLDSYRRFAYVLAMCGLSYAEIGTAMNQREAIARYCVETAAYTVARGKIGALRTDQVPSFLKKRVIPSEVNKECAAYIAANTKRQTPLWKILTPVAGALAIVAVVLVILLAPKGTLTHTSSNNNGGSSGNNSNSNNSGASSAVTVDVNKTYYADITIKDHGTIKVKLEPKDAPITVSNFVDLANKGFYDGLTFHRIMEGFMMQGGDPLGNGTGGSETDIVGEFTSNGYNNKLRHTRGAISMARAYDPNSASSQFFIMHKTSEHLDGDYAVFGYVTEGMDIVDTICESAQPIDNNGTIPAAKQPVIQSIKIRTE